MSISKEQEHIIAVEKLEPITQASKKCSFLFHRDRGEVSNRGT